MATNVAIKAASNAFAATRSPVLNLPGSIAVGDILVGTFICAGGDATGAPPAGWTQIGSEIDAGSGLTMATYWRRADGTEGASVTFTDLWAVAESGTSVCFGVREALSSGDPVAGSGAETTTTGSAKDTASVTPSVANALALAIIGHTANRTFTWDGGIVEEYDSDTTPDGGNNPGFFIGSKLLAGTPATSLGGDASGGAATTELIFFIAPASGTTINDAPAGGIVLGGTATTERVFANAPAGGIVLGGQATTARELSGTVAGGIILGGTATTTRVFDDAPVGGIVLGGTATSDMGGPTFTDTPAGGIVLAGTATTSIELASSPAGGIVLGGTAATSRQLDDVPSGGIRLNGLATSTLEHAVASTGGIVLGGVATSTLIVGSVAQRGEATLTLDPYATATIDLQPAASAELALDEQETADLAFTL